MAVGRTLSGRLEPRPRNDSAGRRGGGTGLAGLVSVARQYSVLIATILRFPEVASVSFDPYAREIRTDFLARRRLSDEEAGELRERLTDALAAYADLERKEPAQRELRMVHADGVATVGLVWRADALEATEIGLVVEFLREALGDDLLTDADPRGGDDGADEDPYLGEELIAEKLADLSRLRGERRLVACRDEGRWIVYHQ
jgi:hypothetical protein